MLTFLRKLFRRTKEIPFKNLWTGRFFEVKNPALKPLWLFDALGLAETVLKMPEFSEMVSIQDGFEFSDDSPEMILKKLKSARSFYQDTYKSFYIFSSTTAYTDLAGNVFWNLRNNPRDIGEMVATAIHERLHSVGYKHKHGASGKEFDEFGNIVKACVYLLLKSEAQNA